MKRNERDRLKEELQDLDDQLVALRTPENSDEINKILTPVRGAIEDLIEPEGKQFARYVIQETRARILKLQEDSAPDTLPSF